MSTEYRYFKVTGGKIMAAIEQWRAEAEQARDTLKDLAAEFDIDQAYGGGGVIYGVSFKDGKVPPGWIKCTGRRMPPGAYKPGKKHPRRKEIFDRMAKAGTPDAHRFTKLCGYDAFQFMVCSGEGHVLNPMRFEQHGEELVLLVPSTGVDPEDATELGTTEQKKAWAAPDNGCCEIKASEYWRMRENAAAAKEAKKRRAA